MTEALPVCAVLPALKQALDRGNCAVLVAPPGAGKTTAVAPALLDAPWVAGRRILLLSPRRLAARAAAERMAELAGEPVGRTIGYRTRLDGKVSAATRIEVVTEGIFTRAIQDDPELPGIAAVLFDEVHERSLEADFGLALALDAQAVLRPDLRLVAMSATVDGARYSALMDGAPVIESEGRMYPVEIRSRPRRADERVEDAMASAIHTALCAEEGSILAFLPGAADIERTAERLRLPPDVALYRLYGALDASAQRAAIAPAPPGTRKVVLATAIAETSLTIDGVRVVIDAGLARRARYDRASGLTRLVTERASQAAVRQRSGRAGRTAPGIAIRLWEDAGTSGLLPYDPPEMLEADLSGLVLDLAIWGTRDPASLKWIDTPPAAAVAEARARLIEMGALDGEGWVTPHGAAIARLPLSPRLAHMLVVGAADGLGATAAHVAALLGEQGLGGRDPDLEVRLRHFLTARDRRAEATRRLAWRWAKLVGAEDAVDPHAAGAVLAHGFPDRVARRRGGSDGDWLMANGRAVRVDPATSLARSEWLVVADATGAAQGARLLAGAALDERTVADVLKARATRAPVLRFDAASGGVIAEEVERLGAITLARRPMANPDAEAVRACLLEAVAARGVDQLPWSEHARSLRARLCFLRAHGEEALPDLSDTALTATLVAWLGPFLDGVRKIGTIDAARLGQALDVLVDWPTRQRVDALAPARLETPAGTSHAIDYGAEGGPRVEVRVQELFGLSRHPTVCNGRVPLVLALLSPAQRPIQTTRDLPGFWSGSWKAVQAEMKGRYPKHPWPDDPAAAAATTRTKRADARRQPA